MTPQHDPTPHKGMALPDHPAGWPYGESMVQRIRREQQDMDAAWRAALEGMNTGVLDVRPVKPSWSVRYGFAVSVMGVAAGLAFAVACVWRGPNPLAWAEAEWLFVAVCLLAGAGYVAMQAENRLKCPPLPLGEAVDQ